MQESKRIALLIDCDNVSHSAIEGVLEELAKHGTVNVRHAHGDWNNPSLSGWAESGSAPARATKGELRQDSSLLKLLRTAIDQTSDDDGWANMGQVGSYISNNNSSFSSINYGYRKISDLIKATDLFEIKLRNGTAMYIRDPKR